MKVVIVGAGALGRLLGGFLSRGGQEVLFIEPDLEVVNAINKKGVGVANLECQGAQCLQYYPAHAAVQGKEISQCDLLFMTVKSYDTEAAIHQAAHLVRPASPIITLQNGLGHIEIMEKACAPDCIISGFTALAGTALGPGEVINDGIGTTYIGHYQQKHTDQLAKICAMLHECGISAEEVTDIESRRWNRMLVHAAINPVSALLRCRNAHLTDNMHSLSLMKKLIDEGRGIAEARGVDLGDADQYEMLFAACRDRADHLSPMLQDIINNRKTEVDALNGILCRYAGKAGVSADTHLIMYELIKGLESEADTANI